MKTKKQFRKIAGVLLFFIFLFSLQSFKDKGKNRKSDGLFYSAVEFAGIQDDFLLFKVEYKKNNPSSSRPVMIKIETDDEQEIFYERYTSSKLTRLFKIKKSEIGKINFEIRSAEKKERYGFVLTTIYKQDISVTKVK